ncbi:5-hydroxytryptamine receptor 4-like [Acanthaster planci]|uniref:5-hydroxytryptamine receptor 4-like n=1 Tax=Acanthaster planci TaxID=133434 RepID=A0A8B7ZL51_ACAPL|nr:5-hydroxytryptamine receptor 4-like [Acanthaster planci]
MAYSSHITFQESALVLNTTPEVESTPHRLNSTLSSSSNAPYTHIEFTCLSVVLSILIILAIIGNSLVLVAMARTKKIRTVTNAFVANLSASDCLGSFALLWSVPGMVSTTPGFPLESDVPCVMAAVLVHLTVGCSLYSLVNIALNRYILVTKPKETYQWLYTRNKIALMVLGSWLVPLCACIIPPFGGIGEFGFDSMTRTCTVNTTHPAADTYKVIQLAVLFPTSCVVLVSYLLIWRHVRRHFNRRQEHDTLYSTDKSTGRSTQPNDGEPVACDAHSHTPTLPLQQAHSSDQGHRIKRDQLAVTKNLSIVILVFVISFAPLAIMMVAKSTRFYLYGEMFLLVSNCTNPLLYAAKHPHLGPVLRAMIRCKCSSDRDA